MLDKLQFITAMLVADLKTKDETGATAVEYGLLVALIAAIIVGVVATLGTEVAAAFQRIVDAIP